jgi:hypothetical protein
VIRATLIGALLFVSACGESTESSNLPVGGDACEEDQIGFKTCGRTASGNSAVLSCLLVGVDFLWVAGETCPAGCTKAHCINPNAMDIGSPDISQPGDSHSNLEGGPLPEVKTDLFTGCTPGLTTCVDPTTMGTCNGEGTDYDPSPCPGGTGCEGGQCKEQTCTPGEPKGECFSSTEYLVCNEGGTLWAPAPCEAPLTCYQGDCVDWDCNPGEKTCKGLSSVQECVEGEPGKYGWEVVEACQSGLCKEGQCVGACDSNVKLNTYLGCNYWAADLDNIEGGQQEAVGLVVSAPGNGTAANITITNNYSGAQLSSAELGGAPLVVQPGSLEVYLLPVFHDLDGSIHTNRTFKIDATQPVTVHQFNPLVGDNVYTNDASLLLPDYAGGQEYLVMSWKLRTWVSTLRGFFTVIATQKGLTQVTVKASAGVIAGSGVPSMSQGQTQLFTLTQGDVLNLEVAGNEGADLTGTSITADRKVAVFGGHECANIHVDYERCDHIESQLFPLATWGKEYVGDTFHKRTNSHADTWRILAGEDNVTVTLDPAVAGPYTLNKGDWVEFDNAEPFVATGTGKFLLGHYLQSCNYPGHEVFCTDISGALGIGDPAFTLSVPTGQYLDGYVFLTPEGYTENYVNIVFDAGTTVLVDGQPLTQTPIAVGSGSMRMVQQPLASGVHALTADGPVGTTVYGYGCHVSYAYPGGLKVGEL